MLLPHREASRLIPRVESSTQLLEARCWSAILNTRESLRIRLTLLVRGPLPSVHELQVVGLAKTSMAINLDHIPLAFADVVPA